MLFTFRQQEPQRNTISHSKWVRQTDPKKEGTDNIPAVTDKAHEPTDIIKNAFLQFKTYIDSRLEDLTNTLQPKASAESEPLLATKKLKRETEVQKLWYKANSRQFIHTQRSKTMC